MHKIGEIWTTDDGSGCLGVVVLVIIAGVIALPIMAGIWVYNAGSNLVQYGTIDTETAHVRAAATAVTRKAEATAIALAPVEADSEYYTGLVERAKISVGTVSDLGYDANRDAIYFNLDFTNGDNRSHTVEVIFRDSNGRQFDRKISLHPGRNLQKIVEPPEPCNCVRFGQSRFAGMSLNDRDLHVELKLIDGFPLQDPRESLSKITAQLILGEARTNILGQTVTVCEIRITNIDTEPHTLSGSFSYEYVYMDLGDEKLENETGEFSLENLRPMETRGARLWVQETGWNFPAHLVSVTLKEVKLQLSDLGTESIHPSIKTKTFTLSGCDYKK